MRIYWLNGKLTIEPETERELGLLAELSGSVRFEPPDEETVPGGSMGLPDLLLEAVVRGQQSSPSSLAIESSDQRPVVGIDVPGKVIPYLHRGPRRS